MIRTNRELKYDAKKSLEGNVGTSFLAEIAGDAMLLTSKIIPLGNMLIAGPISVGIAGVYTKNTDHTKPEFKDLFSGFRENFGENFLLGIVKGLFIVLWSLLFIIPGFIMSYGYAMAEYLMVRDTDLTAMEALRLSRRLMKGRKARLFLLDLSFLGWILLTILTLGIASIYTVPYIKTARTEFFNDLYYEEPAAEAVMTPAPSAA